MFLSSSHFLTLSVIRFVGPDLVPNYLQRLSAVCYMTEENPVS